ncbi:unnamed protein product [Lymnaea stagnalis]|uniref:G-protein coupled receptors family 1 profile domain-containing protein n=1 Tax=Lymnaea stagnalis TaxID=6523 RepID=A0AAV2ILK6_LYMST
MNGYLHIFMSLIGVIGNILVITVVYRQGLKDTPQILMMSLAASDALFSTVTLVIHVPNIIFNVDFYLAKTIVTYINVYVVEIYYFTIVLSFCTFPLISFERMIAVYFPFQVSQICTTFRIKCVLSSLYVYSLAATIISVSYFYPLWLEIPFSNRSYAVVDQTDFLKNNLDVLNLSQIIILMYLLSIIPVSVTTICCLMIILKLVRNSRSRLSKAKIQTKNSRNMQVVKMLLTACILSCVSTIPTVAIDIFTQSEYTEEGFMTLEFTEVLQTINHILFQLSPTLNFFIYLTMSSKFSAKFKQIFQQNSNKLCC